LCGLGIARTSIGAGFAAVDQHRWRGTRLGIALVVALGAQVPALLALGWWWGRLGRRGSQIQRSLNLGLLAWLGSVGLGLSVLLQVLIREGGSLDAFTQSWGWQTLWCQALMTGLLAPMLVSLQLLFWRRRVPS